MWKAIIKKQKTDFSVKPKNIYILGDFWGIEEMNSRTIFDDLSFRRELREIVKSLKRLNISVEFADLADERYKDGDGLYEYDASYGLAVKVKMKNIEKILYFEIPTSGAIREDGPSDVQVYVPRVLQDEEAFIDVILESMGIGEGPTGNVKISQLEVDRQEYTDWWNSLPREEKYNHPAPVFDSEYGASWDEREQGHFG
tara:strand:- start:66 stop:662 length:597 start_codon:yes stop_codon:yes gene_type:complete